MSIFPFYNRQRDLVDEEFWNLDNFSSLPLLYPMMQEAFAAPKAWSSFVDVRGFRNQEVKVTVEANETGNHFVVSARHEDPQGNFQEMRRAVAIPENVDIQKVESHFERGQLHLTGPRKRSAESQMQLAVPQWKLSEDGHQLSSEVSIAGFKPEEIQLRQHGRWITLEANHKTSNSEGSTVNTSNKRVIMRNLLPEGVNASTLHAHYSPSGQMTLTAETDSDKTLLPRVVPVQPTPLPVQ